MRLYADFSRYAMAMRETKADVSMEIRFLTNEVAFRVIMRVDGQPIDARPIIPFTGTNTVSPFVGIAQR